MMWAEIKRGVAEKNVTFNLNDVKNECEEKNFNCDCWRLGKRCKHVERIEKEYLEKEAIDETVDRFIINLGEESSFHSSDDFGEEEEKRLSRTEELSACLKTPFSRM